MLQLLAELFRAPREVPLATVRGLAGALQRMGERAVWDEGLEREARLAESWCVKVGNLGSLEAEHAILFGTVCCAPSMQTLPASECLYIADDPERRRTELREIYARWGFRVDDDGSGRYGPGHITSELDFLAFALQRGLCSETGPVADEFLKQHLGLWGMLFCVATEDQTGSPVLRFAAVALQHLLIDAEESMLGGAPSTQGDFLKWDAAS